MKPPTILPGRQGLPPTSNLPWSAYEEKWRQWIVIGDFCTMWLFIVFLFASVAMRHPWWFCTFWLLPIGVFYRILQQDRRTLYAMLLNKPRDISALTTWVEHPWTGMDPEGREYFCKCGRLVELWKAQYFRSSRRYSMVCECGIGHFQVPPPPGTFSVPGTRRNPVKR